MPRSRKTAQQRLRTEPSIERSVTHISSLGREVTTTGRAAVARLMLRPADTGLATPPRTPLLSEREYADLR